MSAQSNAGIKTLMDAEAESRAIVQKAREKRAKLIKEARDEAKQEIEEYKAQKEAEYQEYEAKHSSGNKQAEDDANKEAEGQVKTIREAGNKGKDEVVKAMLNGVSDVKPQVPDRIEVPQ